MPDLRLRRPCRRPHRLPPALPLGLVSEGSVSPGAVFQSLAFQSLGFRSLGILLLGIPLLALGLLGTGCRGAGKLADRLPPTLEASRVVHGQTLLIETRGADRERTEAAADLAAAAASALGARVWGTVEQSEVGVLNLVPSHVFITLSPDADRVLRLAIQIADESDGAYDPTTGPLRKLWGLEGGEPKIPRDFEIDSMLRRVDYLDIEFAEDGGPSVRRLSRRTEIDLGAVALGAVADAALGALREAEIPAAAVHLGGVHAVYGGSESTPWPIVLFASGDSSAPAAQLLLGEGGVAEIRPAEEHRMENGFVVHGIFDPRDGRPAQHFAATAAVARSAAEAGGAAAALFVLGEEGPGWLESFPQWRGIARARAGEEWASDGVRIRWIDE